MASQKITDLTAYTTPVTGDVVPIIDVANSATKKITVDNFKAGKLLNARTIGGTSFDGSGNITVATATGGFTVTGGALIAPPCSTSIPSINMPSGTIETTPAAGDLEFDGVQMYGTLDTTSSRGMIPVEQFFHLTADATAITQAAGISNYFGATSNIKLVASAYYLVDIYAWFLNTTSGTLTWTLTNSAAPTSQDILYEMSPVAGIVAPPGTATMLIGQFSKDATAARTIVTAALTTAVDHYCHIKMMIQNGSGTSLKIQVTKATGGSITPRVGSFWVARRLSPNNIGTFNA